LRLLIEKLLVVKFKIKFLNPLEKRKKIAYFPQEKKIFAIFFTNKYTWGAQGQMTQFNLMVNSLPRELLEFCFFVVVGFTAGSMGLI